MRFKFTCKCGEELTNCYYSNEDGYFYVTGRCSKCGEKDSTDLTDWLSHIDNMPEEYTFEEFKHEMSYVCGMPVTEDGAVHCCECDEPIYKEDWIGHNFAICPVCEEEVSY